MPGEFYFMALGGLGVSLAGFAGLIAALDRRPPGPDSPVAAWRIRNIVTSSFFVTFGGFGTIAVYQLAQGDEATTARLISLFFVAAIASTVPSEARPGPAWPSEPRRRVALAGEGVNVLLLLANAVVGSVAFLQLLFLVQLVRPVSIFVTTVMDVSRLRVPGEPDHDPGTPNGERDEDPPALA